MINNFFTHDVKYERASFPIPQQGLYVKSICEYCNSTRLGHECDMYFIDFIQQVRTIVNFGHSFPIHLPNPINIETKPHRLARAIIGHLLASNPPTKEPVEHKRVYKLYQNYFLDTTLQLPENVEIFYWLSPSEIQSINLSISYSRAPSGGGHAARDILKFFPLTFWVVWDREDGLELGLNRLNIPKKTNYDSTLAYLFLIMY